MPTSRSPKPGARPPPEPPRPPAYRPFILIAVLGVCAVVVYALPASLVGRVLPPTVGAEDFSGNLWHGSAGSITVDSRPMGALEWRLHPASLLSLTLSAELKWVNVSFVANAVADVDRRGATLHDVQGGGPIENLSGLRVASGWTGTARFTFKELKAAFANGGATLVSAVGDVGVTNLASPNLAGGADLGGYVLHLADGAITPDGDAAAELSDTGGPLELHATVHFSAKDHTGMLSGTIKERADAPPALLRQLENLTQMHERDSQGRIPVELEFTL